MLVRIFSNLTSIQLHPSSSASKSKTRVSVAIFVQCQVIAVRILDKNASYICSHVFAPPRGRFGEPNLAVVRREARRQGYGRLRQRRVQGCPKKATRPTGS